MYYEEELPADFWNREGTPVEDDTPLPDTSPVSSEAAHDTASSSGTSLQEDPRFVALTQLFPGKIIDWQLQDHAKEEHDPDDSPASDATEDESEDTLD